MKKLKNSVITGLVVGTMLLASYDKKGRAFVNHIKENTTEEVSTVAQSLRNPYYGKRTYARAIRRDVRKLARRDDRFKIGKKGNCFNQMIDLANEGYHDKFGTKKNHLKYRLQVNIAHYQTLTRKEKEVK